MGGFERFRLNQDLHHPSMLATGLFVQRALDERLRYVHDTAWATVARSLAPLGEPQFLYTAEGREAILVEHDGVLLEAGLGGGWIHVTAAANDAHAIDGALARLRDLFPAPDPDATHEVAVTFWTYGPHGAVPSVRTIAVPEWEEIATNYASGTRAKLEAVMRGFRPAHGGQLVLWHGTAGTGKTFALRALAWEWRDWCDLHYIVDPDSFFGQHADYLMGVLMQEAMGGAGISPGMFVRMSHMGAAFAELEDDEERAKPWRLLVLEDTGELLRPDAKAVIGQGLSRFLNVVDGLIGQGLRVLVLVTTNEELRALHPAVARPGRCAANVDFAAIPKDEAEAWLAAHGLGAEAAARPQTLAALYAQLEGRDPDDPARSVGFAD